MSKAILFTCFFRPTFTCPCGGIRVVLLLVLIRLIATILRICSLALARVGVRVLILVLVIARVRGCMVY